MVDNAPRPFREKAQEAQEAQQPPAHESERERQNREFWRALHEAERQGVPEMGVAHPGGMRPSTHLGEPRPALEEQERRQANATHESGAA